MNLVKTSILCVFLLLLAGGVLGQKKSGISFFKGNLAEAQAKAAEEDKLIFVDTYADWCGPCKMMARDVFPDPKVASYFNEHFVSVKIDADERENLPWLMDKQIRSIPDLIFMDAEGKVLAREQGYLSSGKFLKLATKAYKKNS